MAIPLALIVNELITNALKYGGPPCRITMRDDPGAMTLRISDTGHGPPEDPGRVGTGSRIVQALVKQIGGRSEPTATSVVTQRI